MKKSLIFLTVFSTIGAFLFIPFVKSSTTNISTAIWILFPLGTAICVFFLSWIGFVFSKKTSSSFAPILSKWERNETLERNDFTLFIKPIIIGVLYAIPVIFLNYFFEVPKNPGTYFQRIATSLWAGTVTEIISHWVIMMGLYWFIKKKWVSIFLSSCCFVLLFHFNAIDGQLNLTIYVGLMNFIAITLTGWIFFKYGLESAILTHIVMHFLMLSFN